MFEIAVGFGVENSLVDGVVDDEFFLSFGVWVFKGGTCVVLYLCVFVELLFGGEESEFLWLFHLPFSLNFSDIEGGPIYLTFKLPLLDCIFIASGINEIS